MNDELENAIADEIGEQAMKEAVAETVVDVVTQTLIQVASVERAADPIPVDRASRGQIAWK